MENIVPKCINNNPCLIVCNVKICKAIPFLCADGQCSCYSQHQKCTTTLKWKNIKQSFLNKIKKSSAQLDGYFTQVEDLYKSVIKQIEISFAQLKNISDDFQLSQLERQVYQNLKQKKFAEFTGELINKIEIELIQAKKQFQVRIIQKEKKQIDKQILILVQMLEGLTKLNVKDQEKKSNSIIKQSLTSFKLDSKITQDFDTLSSFFQKKIAKMDLLYRASENNFQASNFHDKCDGKQHTITIIQTQFGKVIGGYTPLSWKCPQWKDSGNYQADSSKQSFIFSLTNKQKLKLIQGLEQYAIQHDSSYGPIFGGCDIAIYDIANENNSSYANPGWVYNYNNEYTKDNQQSWKKWSGQQSGYYFRIQEWQVYSIIFET